VTAQFLGVISSTLNGEAVVKGRSLFRDRLGEASRRRSSPSSTTRPIRGPTPPPTSTARVSRPAATCSSRRVLLRTFVHSSYSARRAGTVSTGNAVRGGFAGTPGVGCLALQLLPGNRPQADLVAGVDDGVLIQSVSGIHSGVNPISGDFSTGAAGLLISNGQVGAPVREFTIASTLQRMLTDVVEVGGDVEWLPMRAAGVSLVIRDVTMSGA
jgi:PmbA protein